MKKSLIILLCISLFTAIAAGCGKESAQSIPETTVPQTTAAPTTAPNTAPATDDSARSHSAYDYVAVKQDADKINSYFNTTVRGSEFEGVIYMKLGNDFEYISTTGAADSNSHIDNSINTCYYTGNLTAQFTAAAVLKLAEDKKLSLDAPIDEYFPKLNRRDKITVRNLLENTSGIKDYVDHIGTSNRVYFLRSEIDDKISNDNSQKENKKVIENWIMSSEPEFELGSRYGYSNSNYFLLGLIIEEASGMSYEKYLAETILNPLGMKSTGFEQGERLAVAYGGRESGEKLTFPGVGYSAFGLISNLSDVLKWTEAITSDEVLSENSKKLMFTPFDKKAEIRSGFGVELDGNLVCVFSECGAYRSALCYALDKSEVFISFSNNYNSNPESLYEEFKGYLKKYLSY